MMHVLLLLNLVLILLVTAASGAAAPTGGQILLGDLDYRVFPQRTAEEAAVLEWGHSAIISALDASVAEFGPQTSQAALLEVECSPVLASPLNGVREAKKKGEKKGENETEQEQQQQVLLDKLDNAEEVHGNMVVMTNTGGLSGMAMAKLAKASGAAALLVVNIDEDHPDDIYSLPVEDDMDDEDFEMDIPVVMISLNSANVLTTATVTPNMHPSKITNHGMPDRVRLYAGGDRPFFEDVEHLDPTLYLIHNLFTPQECVTMREAAKSKMTLVDKDKNDVLQLMPDASKAHNVDRVLLWKGSLKTHAAQEMDERIEQVTGFPAAHYSDFVVERYLAGESYWGPHYDVNVQSPDNNVIMATVIVFLSEGGGPDVVYPSSKPRPVKITPRVGMAIVHHNTDEEHHLDMATLHAMMPPPSSPPAGHDEEEQYCYIAKKHVFVNPLSTTRRVVLPIMAAPFGGRLPSAIVGLHDFMVARLGPDRGSRYFDKLCVFLPLLVMLLAAQFVFDKFQEHLKKGKTKESSKSKSTTTSPSKGKADKKKRRGKTD